MSVVTSMALVYLGCCSNVVFLELLVTKDPGAGNIITFSQFLFIAIYGFVVTTKFGTVPRKIPIKHYVILTVMFFLVNVTNNYALNFNISMPLHMIFRSGSLLANMVMGIIILKRRYTLQKYLSVMAISVGIIISTIASGKQVSSEESSSDEGSYGFIRWLTGVSLLTFALFLSARMGIYQEMLYTNYGKHPQEALFYSHALPLPGFLLLSSNLLEHASLFSESAPVAGLGIPIMWIYLMGNFLTQYLCISSVYQLTSICTSLTVTLVITLRKFISLLFSILYFGNPFTLTHWVGTVLVFGGTLLFAEVPQMLMAKKKKKE